MTPIPSAIAPAALPAPSGCGREWLSGLHLCASALFPELPRSPELAQPYLTKLTSLRDGVSVYAWNEGGLAIAAARAGVAYRCGPQVRAEAGHAERLSQAQAIRWMCERRRRSAWEIA